MSSYAKGYRVEIQWKLILENKEHIVTRISGSGNPDSPYDLHSTDMEGRSYLWEIKSTSGKSKYFSEGELERIAVLDRISRSRPVLAFVVVKFKGRKKGLKQFVTVRPVFVLKMRRVRFDDRSAWR